ncbi:MAG TPA: C2H2-type zinc finger protein [Acidimicrobiales bacterium]|nr:C2H2-type zinc finger protein [Acidimicrobiales bacterium]
MSTLPTLDEDVAITVTLHLPSGGDLRVTSPRVPSAAALALMDKFASTIATLEAIIADTDTDTDDAPAPLRPLSIVDDRTDAQKREDGDLDTAAEPPPSAAPKRSAGRRAPAVTSATASTTSELAFKCDECPASFDRPQSLGRHRAHRHGYKADTATRPRKSDDAALLLRCDACPFTAPLDKFASLRSHTMTAHGGRLPTGDERTPRAAVVA